MRAKKWNTNFSIYWPENCLLDKMNSIELDHFPPLTSSLARFTTPAPTERATQRDNINTTAFMIAQTKHALTKEKPFLYHTT